MEFNLGVFDRTTVLNVDSRINNCGPLCAKLHKLGATNIRTFVVGDGCALPASAYNRINTQPSKAWNDGPFAKLHRSYNAFKSYQEIIQTAKDDGLKNILLLEDDVEFLPNFDAVFDRSYSILDMLQLNWNILYLGGNHTWAITEEISHNLLRVQGTVCWHAVAINASLFDTILGWEADRPIDDKAKELHNSKTYALWPNCAIQSPGFSSVEGKFRDYSEFWGNKGTSK